MIRQFGEVVTTAQTWRRLRLTHLPSVRWCQVSARLLQAHMKGFTAEVGNVIYIKLWQRYCRTLLDPTPRNWFRLSRVRYHCNRPSKTPWEIGIRRKFCTCMIFIDLLVGYLRDQNILNTFPVSEYIMCSDIIISNNRLQNYWTNTVSNVETNTLEQQN
jgi:hypothetical protein